MIKLRLAAALLLVTFVCSARAQMGGSMPGMSPATRPVDSPEQAKARAGAKAFATAVASDDLAAAKAKFAGTDEDFKFVESMHDMVMASKRLRAAAVTKWPDTFANGKNADVPDAQTLINRIDNQPIEVAGDTASLPGGTTLKQMNGEWKVVNLVNQPGARQMMGMMMPLMIKATADTADEVDKGSYPTFEAAKDALKMKVRDAMGAAISGGQRPVAPTTKPGN